MTEPAPSSFAGDPPDLNGKSILVTGGTGSFGRRFIRTVLARHEPRRLIVFSRDEQKQYDMQNDPDFDHPAMRYFIGDVRDESRLELALRDIDIVVHAAALKHVPTAEYNPFECIRTNVHGAENVVTAAIKAGVRRSIVLSTDKAANPVNIYGASKLASDKIFVAANNLAGLDGARVSVVRYGNVLGSRGSLVPLFERLIAEGANSLPITDERMTRFWITLQQGVDFVLSSLSMMAGGEIFVPKIPSTRVVDIAKCMAPNLPTRPIGIRPGEKLHEVLITVDEARNTLELSDRYVVEPAFHFWIKETHVANGAKPVADGFSYTSDGNAWWLEAGGIEALLAEARA